MDDHPQYYIFTPTRDVNPTWVRIWIVGVGVDIYYRYNKKLEVHQKTTSPSRENLQWWRPISREEAFSIMIKDGIDFVGR